MVNVNLGAEEEFQARHETVATLILSGTSMRVGNMVAKDDESLFIFPDELPEPIYMTIPEAKMFIAAIKVAISEQEKLGPRVE